MPYVAAAWAALGAWTVGGVAVGAIVQAVIINVALSYAARALSSSGTSKYGTVDSIPTNVTVRGTVAARRIVLGRRRVGGVLVFYGASSSGGSTNDYLWYVIAVAGHQVSSITDIWLDQVLIQNSWIDISTGAVTSGQYAGKVYVWKHLGTGAQAADVNLVAAFPEWNSSCRLAGTAYIVIRCQKDDTAFATGAPQDITALVDGALLYDPRLDSTNGGSGAQREDNPSTWVFSQNPALCFRWFVTGGSMVNDQSTRLTAYGLADPNALIDDSYIIAAANDCDEQLTGVSAPPGLTTQTRYQCNLEGSTDQPNRVLLQDILDSMAGTAVIQHGQWRLTAGVYQSPIHTLTQDDLYGDLSVQDTDPSSDRYNAVAATFIDDSQQYIAQTTIYRTDPSYETQDGGQRIPLEIKLNAVTDKWQAQRLCEIRLRRSRMQRKVVLPGGTNLLKIALHENFLFSHARYSWTNRIFACTDRQFEFDQEAGRVTITGRRDDPAVYTDLLTADYTTGTSATDIYQSDGPATPINFVATSVYNGIQFSWDMPTNTNLMSFEIWQSDAPTPFSAATRAWVGFAQRVVLPFRDRKARYFWLLARQTNGAVSGTNPAGSGLLARAVAKWESDNGVLADAWRVGTTGSQGNFSDNFDGINSDSSIVLGGVGGEPLGPDGRSVPLWKTRGTGATNNGGWKNAGDLAGIEPAKSYRSAVWVRWNGVGNPSIFHGTDDVEQLNGAAADNPYFWYAGLSGLLQPNHWYMLIGVIHGQGFVGDGSLTSGVYDGETGERLNVGSGYVTSGAPYGNNYGAEFRFKAGLIPTGWQRVYQFYANNASSLVWFADPRFDELNGNEPSIIDLMKIVGTESIGTNAVTTIGATFVSGNTDVFIGPSGTVVVDVASITVGPFPVDVEVELTATGSAAVNYPSGRDNITGGFSIHAGGSIFLGVNEVRLIANPSTTQPFAAGGFGLSMSFNLPANTAQTYYFYAYGGSGGYSGDVAYGGGATATVSGVSLMAWALKR